MDLPFDGAITRYFREEAPPEIRRTLEETGKAEVANPRFPYPEKWDSKEYDAALATMQIELVKCLASVKARGERVVIVFEGRDGAGKGGTIARFRENLNPRNARVVALPKPSDIEARQWYFQRYIAELPAAGEIVFYDRSWYNRGVIEHVFGFCTPDERERWFAQVRPFEEMLVDEGITLFKLWINVGRATQLERMLKREADPLKQWKLSQIDVDGLSLWDEYTAAISETLDRTDTNFAPWTIIRGDDKRRARVNAIRSVLLRLDYERKDTEALGNVDPRICGTLDLFRSL